MRCAAGAFDLSTVTLPLTQPKISGLGPGGVPVAGEPLTVTTGIWTNPVSPTGASYQWTTSSGEVVCTSSTCYPPQRTGESLTVTVRQDNDQGTAEFVMTPKKMVTGSSRLPVVYRGSATQWPSSSPGISLAVTKQRGSSRA